MIGFLLLYVASSDLVSELSTIAGYISFIDAVLLCAIIPIKTYSNTEADKSTILKENKNKSGIYL